MAREWTDDEVQAEIDKAVQIVREDKQYKMLSDLHSRGNGNPNSSPNDPPPSGGNGNPTDKKKKSLFWGEVGE